MRFLVKMRFCVVLLAAACWASAPISAQDKGRLTAMDVFNIQSARDPQISPDGKKIVYVRSFADVMTDRRYTNLWIMNADGTDHRPLTTGNRHDSSPRWSPDGTRLAFIAEINEKPQIFVRWMDTGQTARITNLENAPAAIAWSPDGKTLAFESLVPEPGPHIADLPKAPEGAKWADPAKAYDRVVYRFNARGYLKPGTMQVFVVSAEGGTPRQVTRGRFSLGAFAESSEPSWTPDGKYLIVSLNARPDWEYEPLDTELYEIAVTDGAMRALTRRVGPDNDPAVSPNGKWIAYTGFDDKYQGYQVRKLYVMNRDGSGGRTLSAQLDRDAQNPTWAGDSSGVYFQYDEQGDTKIAFLPLDGPMRKVAEHVGSGESAYSSGSFSVSRTGTVAFTTSRYDAPGDVAVAAGGTVRTLTALNDGLFGQKKLADVEEIWYESSKDKRRIQGWILKPPDFDPAKKYPLILEIHGGPFANYGARFDLEKQIWAAMGYVVLYANPRGSTSYGEEFGNLIHHAYPGDDFYDLNSGVDAVIAKGYIDTGRLYVTGGSGGGVLTCWMIEHTERFRAAASLYPVINWYSFVLNSDIPVFTSKYWFPGLPWEHTAHYMQRSLTNLVAKVKTPTLVMTGEEDYRTPISEAEQFYEALKLLKVDTVLVRVPGEPHGIRQRPSHHVTKILYIVGWFEKHKT
jgi:dipeptidyl aminopeptidase/acylaminoacyl peptidase